MTILSEPSSYQPRESCSESASSPGCAPERIADLVRAINGHGRPFLENSKARTPITVQSGPWTGYQVRRARKMFLCADRCGAWVRVGQLYLEGECDPYKAGGFGHERLCVKCAGVMVLHTIAEAEVQSAAPAHVSNGGSDDATS